MPMTGFESKETLPKDVELLATALSNVHGHVLIRRERGGLQLYMACPECLQNDGRKELSKKHLAINPERYLGINKFASTYGFWSIDRLVEKFDSCQDPNARPRKRR